ncbi:hypothetical protein FACS189468_5640 [Spirochaetia bacterium]|nr:hypothetical protein FACS189468_5640 [Spirochaetia bacterium]
MGFWNGVSPDSVANASDGFKEFIIGDNDAYIKKVEEKVSESGNDMLVVTFANDDGAEIRHYIVDGEFKQQKLKQLCIAFNIPFGSQSIQSWIGKRGIVVCKQGKPNSNGNVYNQVSYLRPKPGTNVNPRPAHTQPSQPAQQQPQQPYHPPAGQTQQNDEFEDDIPF